MQQRGYCTADKAPEVAMVAAAPSALRRSCKFCDLAIFFAGAGACISSQLTSHIWTCFSVATTAPRVSFKMALRFLNVIFLKPQSSIFFGCRLKAGRRKYLIAQNRKYLKDLTAIDRIFN
jgi:hypothetical protein